MIVPLSPRLEWKRREKTGRASLLYTYNEIYVSRRFIKIKSVQTRKLLVIPVEIPRKFLTRNAGMIRVQIITYRFASASGNFPREGLLLRSMHNNRGITDSRFANQFVIVFECFRMLIAIAVLWLYRFASNAETRELRERVVYSLFTRLRPRWG